MRKRLCLCVEKCGELPMLTRDGCAPVVRRDALPCRPVVEEQLFGIVVVEVSHVHERKRRAVGELKKKF